MIRPVLLDTGPLVALFDKTDPWHEPCLAYASELNGPTVTCWPVITEAVWIARRYPSAIASILTAVRRGSIDVIHIDRDGTGELQGLLERYASLKPQLADVALVYLAERERIDTVFTLDRRDFSVYRTASGKALRMIP